ncbi:MAG: hypothetical protein Q4C42_05250 [Clostridia bacterium]|nr:hypothetical protein [Clostridia bacterium]
MAKTLKYTKEAIINSNRFSRYKDFLVYILDENKMYTVKEVEKTISIYNERKVI